MAKKRTSADLIMELMKGVEGEDKVIILDNNFKGTGCTFKVSKINDYYSPLIVTGLETTAHSDEEPVMDIVFNAKPAQLTLKDIINVIVKFYK